MKQILITFCCMLLLLTTGNTQAGYKEITLPALMKKKQQGDANMVIVDVRTNAEYYDSASRGKQSNIGRIKGAVHVELQELQQNPDAIKQLDKYKDKDVYLICSHSYRSRTASTILLKNGFAHVNNVQGGMTEWYRRYDELAPFMPEFYETKNAYKNISSHQLFTDLNAGKKILLIGIASKPTYFYDSSTINFYKYFPLFRNALYFNYEDSLKVLEAVKKQQSPVVLFNMVNYGAAELAGWLTNKGIKKASYLVGGDYYFYEYVLNKGLWKKVEKFTKTQSDIHFITSPVYCDKIKGNVNMQLIDLRHDSLFNKINDGTKYDFKHLKDAVNFFAGKGEDLFTKQFPDRRKEYILVSQNGIDGLELAGSLAEKGYNIYWIMGGLQRWEWYMNNMETFSCMDRLVME